MPKYIVGIDEVGRGPLAGPVTVAAVAIPIFNSQFLIFKGIKDSKKLAPNRREEWFSKIKNNKKIKYSVVSISHTVIDKRGVSHALHLAVTRCINNLKIENRKLKILLDGSLYAPPEYSQKTIIKGDEKIPVIAAASIMAKVTRDRMMVKMSRKYPNYGFASHKGYGTLAHRMNIKQYGLSEIHRRSYCTRLV